MDKAVKRYVVTGDIAYPSYEDPDGDYVLYKDYAALQAHAEGAERDAARYQRLRDHNNSDRIAIFEMNSDGTPKECGILLIAEADAAIDAAMQQEQTNGRG